MKKLTSIFLGILGIIALTTLTTLTTLADPIILAIPSGGGTTINVPKISVTNLEVFGTFNATNFNAITNIVYFAGTTCYPSNGVGYIGTNNFGGVSSVNGSFGTTVDGAGSVLTTGICASVIIPYDMTITKWMLVGDVSGSIVMDVKTNGTSIVGAGNKPTLSSMITSNAVPASWTRTAVGEGTIVDFYINSVSTIKRINLVLKTTHQ
jgi:hypothetical protein